MIIDMTPRDKTGRWFAWRPVWVGHKLAWLEYVERYYGHKGERVFWTYRLPAPVPNLVPPLSPNQEGDKDGGGV